MRRLLSLAAGVSLLALASLPAAAQTWSGPSGTNTGFLVESYPSGKAFGALAVYDAGGSPITYIFDGNDQDSTHVNGALYAPSNGQTLGGACRTVAMAASSTTLRATFANARQGSYNTGGSDVALTRTEIQSGYPEPTSGANYINRGWYWNPDCPGQGFHLEVQGDTIFIFGFMYDETGRGTWFYSSGTLVRNTSNATSSFSGPAQQCSRATGSTVCDSALGTITFQFPRNNAAVMTAPNGTVVNLEPYTP